MSMSSRGGAAVHVRVVRGALVTGFADFRALYTVRSWTLGWMSRVLCQVSFFALAGRLLADEEATRFLLIGNAVSIMVLEASVVVASTAWERASGTLPLLVAAPVHPAFVFFGRSLFGVAVGTVSSSVALLALAPLFGVALPWPAAVLVVPLITLVGFACYCFFLVLAGLALRATHLRNLVSNVAALGLIAFCGVQVPLVFWPSWIQAVAGFLPLTHGLQAVRLLLDSAGAGQVVAATALELLIGVGWLVIAVLTFRGFVESGRRDGSIEFAD
ncbi:ABC transporter permease [Streptomyces althioticus]|uniref:ABC transporter permease n=2 Tax=Streptomyces althioticus TaxID=83380 RepID=UPI00340EBA88